MQEAVDDRDVGGGRDRTRHGQNGNAAREGDGELIDVDINILDVGGEAIRRNVGAVDHRAGRLKVHIAQRAHAVGQKHGVARRVDINNVPTCKNRVPCGCAEAGHTCRGQPHHRPAVVQARPWQRAHMDKRTQYRAGLNAR